MAHYAKPLSLFFLAAVLSNSLHIEARESRFFSKATQDKNKATNIDVAESESPLLAPMLAPVPAPEIEPPVSENGYGLFGLESSEFPSTKTTTATAATTIDTEQLAENYEESGPYNNNNKGYSNYNYNYNNNNNGYSNYNDNNNNNGYYNNNNNGYTNGYNNNNDNGYEAEKQGMSDTRFLENGRYYYGDNGQRGSALHSNQINSNEFDTMEEYERQQGYKYPESQGEYVP